MCNNSDAIYNDSLSISHVSHHLNNIVYLQVEYTMDTAVNVTRDIYNCIDGHDVPYTYQGGRAGHMTGRHNGYGRSSFGRRGHFSGHEPSCWSVSGRCA